MSLRLDYRQDIKGQPEKPAAVALQDSMFRHSWGYLTAKSF